MRPIELKLSVYGEDAVHRDLLRFSARMVDASVAWEAIADMFYASEERQFESEGSWASGGWAPLAPSTVAEKMRHDWDLRILHRTLDLRSSLTSANAGGSVKIVTPDSLYVGSAVEYGKYHQHGTSRMPMRKPVELPEDVKVGMVKILQRFLVHGVVP